MKETPQMQYIYALCNRNLLVNRRASGRKPDWFGVSKLFTHRYSYIYMVSNINFSNIFLQIGKNLMPYLRTPLATRLLGQ